MTTVTRISEYKLSTQTKSGYVAKQVFEIPNVSVFVEFEANVNPSKIVLKTDNCLILDFGYRKDTFNF